MEGLPKVLLLVDGNGLLHRSFHGVPMLYTADAKPTNAAYGFMRALLRTIDTIQPDYLGVTFDRGRSGRTEKLSSYKSNRGPALEELFVQFEYVEDILAGLGAACVAVPGFEADDVIGTLTQRAVQRGLYVVILSGDRDIFQLASDKVRISYLSNKLEPELYDRDGVREKMGLWPEQLPDYKGLAGDSSDCIPGVPGVGTTTATKLLQRFTDLEDVYANLDLAATIVARRFVTKIESNREIAFLSRDLGRIITDVPVDVQEMEQLAWNPDWDGAAEKMAVYEMHSLIGRLPGSNGHRDAQVTQPASPAEPVAAQTILASGVPYRTLRSEEEINAFVTRALTFDVFAFDVETKGLGRTVPLVGVALAIPGEAVYIPVQCKRDTGTLFADVTEGLPYKVVIKALQPLFDSGLLKVAHNLKYDWHIMRAHGTPRIAGPFFDTMIAAGLTHNPKLGLKELAPTLLGVPMTHFVELIKGKQTIADVPVETVAKYASADAAYTLALRDVMVKRLKEYGAENLFYKLEMPLCEVLCEMERDGVRFDLERAAQVMPALRERIAGLRAEINRIAGYDVAVTSDVSVAQLLYDKLGLPCLATTRKGKQSVSGGVLTKLAKSNPHPILEPLIACRRANQMLKFLDMYVPAAQGDGRLHTDYNQVFVTTGRLSSREPNLQNVAKGKYEFGDEEDEAAEIRAFFVAREGWWLYSYDFSQIELRVLAHFTQDPELLAAFARGEDIHSVTASVIADVPLDEVTKQQRGFGKTINFGLMYGMGAKGLSLRTGTAVEEAQEFLARYFARFARVRPFMDQVCEAVRRRGYVKTLFGRRRYFDTPAGMDDLARLELLRKWRNAIINTPIQGSAADLLKLAMVKVAQALKERGLRTRLVLTVHDELIFEVPDDEKDIVRDMLQEIMEHVVQLAVPTPTDLAIGKTWADL